MTTTREGVSALDPWTRWALPHTPENLVESAELLGLIKQQTNQVKDKRTQQSGKPTLPPRDPDGKFLKFCELTRRLASSNLLFQARDFTLKFSNLFREGWIISQRI